LRARFRDLLERYGLCGDEDLTFADIGIDSLSLAQLLADLQALLEEHGAGNLADRVDSRLMQRITLSELFAALAHLESGSRHRTVALQRLFARLGREVERHEREAMRADALLDYPASVPASGRNELPGDILLTGATGFFGPFLLRSLLEQTSHAYHVLVRGTDPADARHRLENALRRAGVWTPSVAAALLRRVSIVRGDLARRNLGMLPEQWASLASRIGAIVHNAALVNYVLNYDALKPHNVDGTRELLRLAVSGRAKEFHLISSTFVFGWTPASRLDEADANDAMRHLDFGYAQSKWVAERLVLRARNRGLAASIYRPSLISASTAGVGSRDDIAVRLLAFMIRHGIAVDARNQISFVPADVAANNIAAILNGRLSIGETFHVTADRYYNLADVTRVITQEYGYRFEYYGIPRFIEEIRRRCERDDPLYPLVDFLTRSHPKIAAMQDKRYGSDRYRTARDGSRDGRPDPPLREIVAAIVGFMRREGLVGESAPVATSTATGGTRAALRG